MWDTLKTILFKSQPWNNIHSEYLLIFNPTTYTVTKLGAIFRIKRYIDMLADGEDIPVVKIRKNDEFQDVAQSLERLRKRIADFKK